MIKPKKKRRVKKMAIPAKRRRPGQPANGFVRTSDREARRRIREGE